MKKLFLHIVIVLISCFAVAQNAVKIDDLQCEMLKNPLGIDVLQPRLSWQFNTNETKLEQKAYQILVASSLEKLNNNNADLWDSGKVQSDASINIAYSGAALSSRDEAFWKVKVWTNKGETQWSETAFWKTNRFKKEDKKSQSLYYGYGLIRALY